MSSLNRFLKQNKKVKENVKYAVTKSLTDENGKALEWEIKPLTTKENNALQEECTVEVQVKGKPNMFRPKLDSQEYLKKMLVASVVDPDLYNSELQDSYGVMTPEDLLEEMVDDVGEFTAFVSFVQELNGFNVGLSEKVEEAKN